MHKADTLYVPSTLLNSLQVLTDYLTLITKPRDLSYYYLYFAEEAEVQKVQSDLPKVAHLS